MPRHWKRALAARLLACAMSFCGTATASGIPAGWQLSLDNDAFAPNDHDRDYTGGISFTYSSPTPHGGAAHPPRISLDAVIGFIDRRTGMGERPVRQTFYASEAGLAAFTPDDIEETEAQQGDRPYASLLYFSSSRQTLSPDGQQATNRTFTLAALGLALSADLQNAIHGLLNLRSAQGWEHQISAGGEPTLRYSLSRQTRHWQRRRANGIDVDLSSTFKGNLGYLTDLGWGVSGRLGRIASPWWTHNPLLEEYAERGSAHTTRGAKRSQFYLWGGAFARARLYNALLQGQFRDSTVSYSRHELNPVIVDGWIGLVYVFPGGIRLAYSWHAQTSEVRHGRADRLVSWGTLGVAADFR